MHGKTEKERKGRKMTYVEEKKEAMNEEEREFTTPDRMRLRREINRRKAEDRQFYESSAVVSIEIENIRPNRSQPRVNFESNATIRLADSIRRYGILQPLTVRLVCEERTSDALSEAAILSSNSHGISACFEIIAGERRFRAAKMLGMRSVPCIIMGADDKQSAELALIENLLREDLNIFETAKAIKKLIENFKLTQEEVAKRLSMSQSAIANKLRLLKYTPEEEQVILENHLTERHARALLKLSESKERLAAMKVIIRSHMNVSSAESYIEKLILSKEEDSLPVQMRKIPIIKDIRVFYNSLDRALEIVKSAGVDAVSTKHESENGVTIEISIPFPMQARG